MTKKKILLIDDNSHVTQVLSHGLTAVGYETSAENDPTRALQTALAFKPDLVLLDVDMPGMDGGDVMQELRSQREFRETPMIFLTSLATPQDTAARDDASETVLSKPITIVELTRQIEMKLG